VEVVELQGVGSSEWDELVAGEQQPWGGGAAEALEWADKQRHVGIRDEHGRLLALAGLVRASVTVEGRVELPVVGIGGVIVTRPARGRGLARPLLERTLELAGELGPEHAMLFCREQLRALYAKFGFRAIESPVHAAQAGGQVEVPMCAMWRGLRDGAAAWPAGAVTVRGLPF
jgi:predicted GNAT family N-acyltransferase